MSPRRAGRGTLVAALAVGAVALSGCGFSGLYNAPLPGGADLGDHPLTITAYFTDVLDLVPQSAVRVNNAPVGKVEAISLDQCAAPGSRVGSSSSVWCAKVKVEVNDDVKLPNDATAAIQQTSLLGEKFVALIDPHARADALTTKPDCGEVGELPCLKNHAVIHLTRNNKYGYREMVNTSAPEAEDVLGALSLLLNGGGLNQIQLIAHELNNALDSKSRQTATRDLLTQLTSFTGTLDQQKDKITTSLSNIDTLAKTLKNQQTVLNESLAVFPKALHVLSGERTRLVTLLQSLSRFGSVATRVVNASQTELTAALKSLDPVVVKLAQAGSALPKALRIAGTIPFPLGTTREFVKGDYANLDAYVQLNLKDLLCQTGNTTLCNLAQTLPLSEQSKRLTVKTNSITRLTNNLVGSRP